MSGEAIGIVRAAPVRTSKRTHGATSLEQNASGAYRWGMEGS